MKKNIFIVAGSVALIFIIIALVDAFAPKPIDFTPYYTTYKKEPLGLYVLNKESKSIFKDSKIKKFHKSAYEYLDELYNYETGKYNNRGTYLKISQEHDIDQESAKELLNYAGYGNTVVICAKTFPSVITDTLGLKINGKKADSAYTYLANKPKERYKFKVDVADTYFDSLPKSNDSIKILGYEKMADTVVPNFIEAKFGYGRIVLNTQPSAFSNYYLLKDKHYKYAEAIASTIPVGNIYWQVQDIASEENSRMSYFLREPSFRSFWYLGLGCLFIFIVFNARRRQRVVPVIPPVTNTTVEFTKTIGNLYYQESNHHDIIDKKIIYFLEHIRTEYLIDTYTLDDAFAEKLHLKSGKPMEDIKKVIQLITKHRNNAGSTEADVIAINKAIEKIRL